MTEPGKYHDNYLDQLCIWLFSRKIATALGKPIALQGYDGFVALSQAMLEGRNATEQQAIVATVLKSLVPAPVLASIRALFYPTQRICEWNAWFATKLFEWLVGPCTVEEIEVQDEQHQVRRQKSGVHIERCRYLEASGCVGACINLCKLPTQTFFTEDFGIPLTMTPNFEDFSCKMVFGQQPPPLETEVAYQQPCLRAECPQPQSQTQSCPRVRL